MTTTHNKFLVKIAVKMVGIAAKNGSALMVGNAFSCSVSKL